MLKIYGFVFHFLEQPAEKPARKFVHILGALKKIFASSAS